jgi:antitoxin ParD1/3/4
MNVSLTPRLEEMVQEHVRSGRYSSASEVIRAALRLLEDHEREQAVRFEQLKADVQKGIDDLDAGRSAELTHEVFEEIKARGRAELARRTRTSGSRKRKGPAV